MKKNFVYLLALFIMTLKTIPASASWRNLIVCNNNVSVIYETNIQTTKTTYKAQIMNKNIIRHSGFEESTNSLELLDSSFYSPQHKGLSFEVKKYGREFKIRQLDQGNIFSFEVVSPQEITCAQEACTSGCYAGDTAVWDCVDLRVNPESTLYKETAYCRIE
jgi:hypothetical protein